MSNTIRLFSTLIIFFYFKSYSQISSTIDTIDYNKIKYIQLNKKFIIGSSLNIKGDGKKIIPKKIYPIEGKIVLSDSINVKNLIITYDFLPNGLPVIVGPPWKTLPKIYSTKNNNKGIPNIIQSNNKTLNIEPTGSFFRQISISPMGGSDFTGGMQMQINGKLSNSIMVNGVLTDQDLPFQPDGTTRELDDLDKVYLQVVHPKFTFDAGDIIYKYIDQYNNINRKLEGINNTFNYGAFSGSSVYATSKGQYQTFEMKGRDGDQGPYKLIGKDGMRDIFVLSGTEKVWVNGNRLMRGDNYDYTIDYSRGEINFTPRILIDFDTDLLFEYQYSDFEYQKEFIGGNIRNKIGSFGSITMGLFNESDKYKEDEFDIKILDSLKNISNGSIKLSTAILDTVGEYILEGEVFIYNTLEYGQDVTRYNVTFQFDPEGAYQRKISDLGRIYYKYIPESERNSLFDLYSPFRIVNTPKSRQLLFLGGEYKLNENISINGKLLGTKNQLNILNDMSSLDGASYIVDTRIDSLDFKLLKINLSFKDWKRNRNYFPFGRENDILNTRLWNLDSTIINDSRETIFQTDLIINHFGQSNIELAKLIIGNQFTRTRLKYLQKFSRHNFKNSFFQYTSVKNGQSIFNRSNVKLEYNAQKYSPFISYLNEENSFLNRFNKAGIGINIDRRKVKLKTGIDYRNDQSYSHENFWINDINDVVGYTSYIINNGNGWKQNIIYKKRIKSVLEKQLFNYSLLDFGIVYKNMGKPMFLDIRAKKEESFSEKRAIVYDSVGSGLGQYRYDSVFNTYVFDPNGSYVSYTILTGERESNTILQGSQKFSIDFSKIFKSSNLIIRGNSRQEYRGKGSIFSTLMGIDIYNNQSSEINLFSRLEAMFYNSRHFFLWIENQQLLDGYDPRGNDLRIHKQVGINIDQGISNYLTVQNRITINKRYITSTVSILRNRNMVGFWNDFKFKVKPNNFMDINLGILGGIEKGEQLETPFFASSYGINCLGNLFFKKTGRLQLETIIVQTQENNNSKFLPPEALNGYPVGMSFRTNAQLQYFINNALSIIFNLNTINDDRYNKFFNLKGEVRAHF